MAGLQALASVRPARSLAPGEVLIAQGAPGGDLFILEDGELAVERDGVPVTTISAPNALVGEMSLLLGTPNSATVRAASHARVRTIENARNHLLQDPELTIRLASLVAARLDATTALLVNLAKEHPGKSEQGLLARILSALTLQADDTATVTRHDLFG
jgi:CRP/FNR family cyclic AMP-dependent transcriptional regulator